MAKTANVNARIEPEIKEKAEAILEELGIPASSAINMFYRQIIANGGMPFEMKLYRKPLNINEMTAEQLDNALEAAYKADIADNAMPAAEAFEKLRRSHGI